EHGDRDREGEIQAQVGVAAERPERLLRAVAGGRDAVRAQPDPGEERDERDVVPGPGVEGIERLAEELAPEGGERHVSGRARLRAAFRSGARTPSSPWRPACRLCARR